MGGPLRDRHAVRPAVAFDSWALTAVLSSSRKQPAIGVERRSLERRWDDQHCDRRNDEKHGGDEAAV
ncbi:MAG: hypothetical protein VX453_05685, partial [Acidobacteriota bacterium]|nr:hypothetical protein [Acidobacteriota bacterium]